MPRIITALMVAAFVLGSIWGCQTTDDPKKGGLFSYNPKAYERRLEDRKSELETLERDTARQKQAAEELEATRAQKTAERDSLRREIKLLDDDIISLEKKIEGIQAKTKSQESEKWRMNVKVKALKAELENLRSTPQDDVEAKEKEIEALKQKIDLLLEEAEALTRM